MLLAARLGDKQAAVARGSVEEPALVRVLGRMLCADGIVGAEAAQVDRRMRELAPHAGSADPGKLAILVALNLADELAQSLEQATGERSEIESRVAELSERLVEALGR